MLPTDGGISVLGGVMMKLVFRSRFFLLVILPLHNK